MKSKPRFTRSIWLIAIGITMGNTAYAQVKATTAEVNTGIDDTKFITPLALQGAKYLDQNGGKISATTSGAANTYTATIDPAITSYSSGQLFYIKITTANTGTSTLNLNGLGPKALVKDAATALVSGDLLANKVYSVYYDGTNFQVLNAMNNTPKTQLLSLGTASGNISITNGNNITLNNIGSTGVITDANKLPLYGFYPYGNINGSTNFPSATGAGIKMVRADTSAYGYFEFNRPIASTDLLYYRVGTGNTTFSPWQSIASREWASTQFQSAYTVANNKISGRYAAGPGAPQDVTLGAGLTLKSSGILYSGVESGADGTYMKVIKVSNPSGGQFKGLSTETGAIKIKLPSNQTVMFAIRGTIYAYDAGTSTNKSCDFLITCYGSAMGNGYSATFSGNNAPNYPVRWYTDGTTPAIYIGELTNSWSYTAVTIDEVQASYNGATLPSVAEGWSISMANEFTGTLSAAQTNTLPFSNLSQPLTGFAVGTNIALTNVDNVIGAFGKIQGQLNSRVNFNATQPAGTVLAAPSLAIGTPAFRSLNRSDTKAIFGADGTSGVLDWNDITNTQPGFSPTLLYGNATNGFGNATYYHPFTVMYSTKDGAGNLTQLAYPYNPGVADGIFYRTRYSNVYTPWRKVWDSINFTNLSQLTTRNFADLQNKPTTLSGFGITDAATQASVTTMDANVVHKTGNESIAGTKLFSSSVGIGTTNTLSYKLAVGGGIIAESVKVKPQSGWADYVFEKDYPILPLKDLEYFISKNKHLPGIPTATEVKKEGIDLGEINTKLLQKIEELTLYLIDLRKENEILKKRMDKLEKN